MGMQAVDLAIQNGVDLDGTPIPQKNARSIQQNYG